MEKHGLSRQRRFWPPKRAHLWFVHWADQIHACIFPRARRMVGRGVPAEPFLPVFQTSCPLPHWLAGDGSPHQGPCHPIKGHQKVEAEGRRGHKLEMRPAEAGREKGVEWPHSPPQAARKWRRPPRIPGGPGALALHGEGRASSRPRARGVPVMSQKSPADTARTKPGPPGMGLDRFWIGTKEGHGHRPTKQTPICPMPPLTLRPCFPTASSSAIQCANARIKEGARLLPPPRGAWRGHEWDVHAWKKENGRGRDGGSTALGRRGKHDSAPATIKTFADGPSGRMQQRPPAVLPPPPFPFVPKAQSHCRSFHRAAPPSRRGANACAHPMP